MTESDNLLDRIRRIMNSHGLTNSQFCEKIGVQRSLLSHVFSKRNRPSLDFLLKIHAAFDNITLDWLLLGQGDINLPNDLFNIEVSDIDDNSNRDYSGQKDQEIKKDIPLLTAYPDKSFIEKTNQSNSGLSDKPITIVFLYPDGTFKTFQNRTQ